MQARVLARIQAFASWALCVWGKRSKLLQSKVFQQSNFCKTRAFTRNWTSFPQSGYIILATFHKKLHSLLDWLRRDRWSLVLFWENSLLSSFVLCEMKGLLLAQRPALPWVLYTVFHCVAKSLLFPTSPHLLDLASKAQQDLKPNKILMQQKQNPAIF